MGWASGSSLAAELWAEIEPHITGLSTKCKVARMFWRAFEAYDCDTLMEAENLAIACRFDWTHLECLDETECGKWGCQDTAVGEGIHPEMGSKKYPYETFACTKHRGELVEFKEYGS